MILCVWGGGVLWLEAQDSAHNPATPPPKQATVLATMFTKTTKEDKKEKAKASKLKRVKPKKASGGGGCCGSKPKTAGVFAAIAVSV